jgi:hypothetical protein
MSIGRDMMTKEEFFENQPDCKDCIHYPTCELIDDPELDSEFCQEWEPEWGQE